MKGAPSSPQSELAAAISCPRPAAALSRWMISAQPSCSVSAEREMPSASVICAAVSPLGSELGHSNSGANTKCTRATQEK